MAFDLMLICGSVRAGSTNAATVRAVSELLPAGASALDYRGLADLPHFNPDLDVDPLPAAVVELREGIEQAGALLFCTPEYAGALPGSLKNLLDWTIGGYQIGGKPVAWINCSDRGAAGAHAELRTVLGYAGTRIIEDACARVQVGRAAVQPDGSITDPDVRRELAAAVQLLCEQAQQV